MSNWDQRFIEAAALVALWSKDPSTKVGAIITDHKHRILGTGYNGFPRGIKDLAPRYYDREKKYQMVVHAEINAILNAARSVDNATLYCTFFPCPRCAAVIIQAGIRRIVTVPNASDDRYKEQRQLSEEMFREAGVAFI